MLKKILVVIAIVMVIVLSFKYCQFKKTDNSEITADSDLIQQQIVNVGKLVVTEGHFSQVFTFKDKDKYMIDLISFDKKALIVVNTDVSVSYDLRQIKYDVNSENKTITILYIPKEEIKINPDIKFYDVTQSTMNKFDGDDYNKINKNVRESLAKKIENSSLKKNAQNRLISELSKILILTNTMGWTLKYNGQTIDFDSIGKIEL